MQKGDVKETHASILETVNYTAINHQKLKMELKSL